MCLLHQWNFGKIFWLFNIFQDSRPVVNLGLNTSFVFNQQLLLVRVRTPDQTRTHTHTTTDISTKGLVDLETSEGFMVGFWLQYECKVWSAGAFNSSNSSCSWCQPGTYQTESGQNELTCKKIIYWCILPSDGNGIPGHTTRVLQ